MRSLCKAATTLGLSLILAMGACAAPEQRPQPATPDRQEPAMLRASYGTEYEQRGRVLVAYASRAGSTAGVADAIGKTLAQAGVRVDVLPVTEVGDLTPYTAFVVGSAIQGGRWLPEAMEFVQAHQAALASKPFAAFLVCMTLTMKGDGHREHVATWLAPVRALVHPVSEGLFTGALDIDKVPSWRDRLGFRLSVLFGVWSAGDHRDWQAIHAWAEALVPLLGIAAPAVEDAGAAQGG